MRQAPRKFTSNTAQKYRLMLVDDEKAVLTALERCLRADNYRIDCFSDPMQALEQAQQKPYDLVISDYRMPVIDGIILLAFIRQLQPDAVRLVLSAYADLNALFESINQARIYSYIKKPWNPHELRSIVADALEQARQLKEDRQLAEQTRRKRRLIPLEMQYPGNTKVQQDLSGAMNLE